MNARDRDHLAIVMSGGGALAAYQVGLLRHLADHYPRLRVPILTGVSAGAVNAAALAAVRGTFAERVAALERAWCELSPARVFQVNSLHLVSRAVRLGLRLVSGKRRPVKRPRSLLDTEPLRAFLSERFSAADGSLKGIAENLATGELRALAITAASYSTDRSVTWVQGVDDLDWERGHRISKSVAMSVEHVMASTALPLVFPAVQIDDEWFGDGGMRLTAPFSPALHLGARRILSISTRSAKENGVTTAQQPYPPPAQIAGTILNSLFLEHSADDALRIQRINRLIDSLPAAQRGGMRKIELLVLRPSVDLGALANDHEPRLPRMLRFMIQGLGSSETRDNGLLSLLMFQNDYLRALIDIGRRDAEQRHDEIAAFLHPSTMRD